MKTERAPEARACIQRAYSANPRPENACSSRELVVEAAGIETCAAVSRTQSFQALTVQEAGVRLECNRSRRPPTSVCRLLVGIVLLVDLVVDDVSVVSGNRMA